MIAALAISLGVSFVINVILLILFFTKSPLSRKSYETNKKIRIAFNSVMVDMRKLDQLIPRPARED